MDDTTTLQSFTLCLHPLNKRIKTKQNTPLPPSATLLSPPPQSDVLWLTGWWMPGGCPRLLAVRQPRVRASPCCWTAEEWSWGTSPGLSWSLLSPWRPKRKLIGHDCLFLETFSLQSVLYWAHPLTQTPQCRRPWRRCPMSTAPHLLAAPLKSKRRTFLKKTTRQNQ